MFDLNDIELLLLLLVSVYGVVVLFRLFGIFRKEACPQCGGKLNRRPRNTGDYISKALTLSILPFRRYKCIRCGWNGIRWNLDKEVNKGPRP